MFKLEGFIMKMSFNTNKVLYVAEAIGSTYEGVNLDFTVDEHKTEAHLKKHPFGKTPTLTHGDKTMFESGAICRYMASVSNSPLYPVADHFKRCQVDQWMDFFSSHLGKWTATALFERVFKKEFGMGEENEEVYTEATNFFNQQCESLNTYLEDKKFLCGSEMTIADIFAYSYLEVAEAAGLPLSKHPNVNNWVKAISDQKFIAEVQKKFH